MTLPGIVVDEEFISQFAQPWIWGTCEFTLSDIIDSLLWICGVVQLYAIWEIHSWCSSLTCVAHSLCANGVSLVIRLFFVWNCSFVISIGDQNFYEAGFLSRFLLRYDEINKSPSQKNKNKNKGIFMYLNLVRWFNSWLGCDCTFLIAVYFALQYLSCVTKL